MPSHLPPRMCRHFPPRQLQPLPDVQKHMPAKRLLSQKRHKRHGPPRAHHASKPRAWRHRRRKPTHHRHERYRHSATATNIPPSDIARPAHRPPDHICSRHTFQSGRQQPANDRSVRHTTAFSHHCCDTISTSPDPSRRHHTKARMGTTKSSSNARPPRSAFRPRCRGSSADSQVEESHRLGISWYWREVMMSCLLAWYGLIGTSSVTPQEHLSPSICRMYKNYAL